jgi:ubiquinone/menaquinone biosynthesis C-methylase UbiE
MENKKQWEKAAKTYSTPHIRKKFIRTPAFLKAFGNVKNKKILDLGCGDGYYCRILAKKKAKMTGVDFSSASIKLAKKEKEKHIEGIHYFQSDIAKMPFLKDNYFDYAIADMVFVTIPTQKKYIQVIQEVHRVLKNGGTVIISKGHPANFNRVEKSKFYKLNYAREPSYFDSLTPQHVQITINGDSVKWTNYHRTLEDFVNPWLKNGFMMEKIIEPQPTHGALKKFNQYLKGTEKIPFFILIKLKKK